MSNSSCKGQGGSPLDELAELLQCRWKNIDQAKQKTLGTLEQLSKIIEGKPGADTSVIVHGSLARRECTRGSDLDWTLLVDGVADASVQQTFLAIKNALNDETAFSQLGLEKPGRQGTFGALTFSQPMMHYIGGEEDSNSNTTRRVLLLLEALPVGERLKAFERVRQGVLRRYLDEDRGLLRKNTDGTNLRWVPLFLLNDFARYWRTIAVDFAYKQFDRGNKGYALRSIKLGVSRKLLFASGLLACFWCDPEVSKDETLEPRKQSLVSCLDAFFSWTPLERIASFFVVHTRGSQSKFIRETASELFSAYDDFLDLLNNTEKRKHLDELKPGDEETDIVFKEARMMRKRFRLAIQNMFLHQDSPLYKHSIEKGVF
jgi:predicted nucleotidyltransferase